MRTSLLLLLLLLWRLVAPACTIVSGTDRRGQTWAMNNEDFFHTASNYVNVFPATDKNSLGYITFTYGSPESGIQGGANEAGVFFDINALPPQKDKLRHGRQPFPHGSMLVYLLQHCQSVPQFLALWDTYYMPDMGDVQLHIADRQGNLAVIAPDTIVRATQQLTSTNFNVCETGPAKQTCWRYPIAQRLLATQGVSQQSLVQIAQETSEREFTTTVYTNIHNLTTGDIWFYLAEDYRTAWHTNIHTLLQQGKKNILLASQFPQNASLTLTKLLHNQPRTDLVEQFLRTSRLSDQEKESVLRLTFLNCFYIEKDFAQASVLFPIWERYMGVNPRLDSTEVQFTKAEVLATQGRYQAAVQTLQTVKKPSWKTAALLRNLLKQEPDNVSLALAGFLQAKAVAVEFKGEYNFLRFLQKTPKGWLLRMKTDRPELKYCYYVDGKRVLSQSQPVLPHQETVKGDFAPFNLLKL
ncbi:carcinine hydrolase/isopenicillin-N N-acyltransferase family protein [Hymenobacter sp. GOD-10R]|uniref:carcinine hydrolase/isopenicillin-N N-acyltransferase family protein n=1 Tax=Hymenobacter sp. GOD-10R TaxID=3093922 RepID=UPI002D79D9E2|nr:carcinine hydrolase/isopenicillin-N N-acyltransferase family protein [Hymenobacter sp. GOD-10R]WRQ31068.1 carcinine hydrolase/isopenicillin-N N-acyltransferase family protein [Hymenobacter sp. GOD-10R]